MSATGADRPSVEGKDPDLPIHARLHRGKLELGMDLAGASLHRRGYRTDAGEAPLRENLAAALLHRAGWPAIAADNEDFVDPLCGSGTLLIEAAMMATDSAPGLSRSFAFERWPGHDAETWQQLRHEAEQRRDAALRSNRSRFSGQRSRQSGYPGRLAQY
jgi:Predicted N6-adenine-specific DNA methylase